VSGVGIFNAPVATVLSPTRRRVLVACAPGRTHAGSGNAEQWMMSMAYWAAARRAACFLLALVVMSGCASHGPGGWGNDAAAGDETERTAYDQGYARESEMRNDLRHFADFFAARYVRSLRTIEEQYPDARTRTWGLAERVFTLTAIFELAVDPDVGVALVDIVTLVTLTRLVWEDHWQAEVYGDAADDGVEALRDLESDIERLALKVISEAQLAELQQAATQFVRDHPEQTEVSFIRLSSSTMAGSVSVLEEARRPGGLFGIGDATSAIEDAQALLERSLWYLTRLQGIMRWQAQLTYSHVVNYPEMQTLIGNIDSLSGLLPVLPGQIAEASLTVSRELMREITVEREAAINQILQGFADERRATLQTIAASDGPRAALSDLRLTLDSANVLIDNLQEVLDQVSPLIGTTTADDQPSRPFDIREYRDTAAEVGAVVDRLNATLQTMEGLLEHSSVVEGVPYLYEKGNDLIFNALLAGLALVLVLLAGLFVLMMMFRPRPAPPPNP
jgi:hypothetical protein